MAIAYIIMVNPLILHANGAGFPLNAAITSTVAIIVVMTIFASFVIKLPFVLALGWESMQLLHIIWFCMTN